MSTITEHDLLPQTVRRFAGVTPQAPFLIEVTGRVVSYAEAHDRALAWAGRLEAAGVQPGDRVVVMLGNSAEYVLLSLGISWLGALEVPVNTAYLGSLLQHVLDDAEPTMVVTEATHLPRFADLEHGLADGVRHVVSLDGPGAAELPFDVVVDLPAGDTDVSRPGPQPHDLAAILYTSGTTGPSKGVMTTWAQTAHTMRTAFDIDDMDAGDRMYSPFPLFHVSGRNFVFMAAHLGGACVIREVFSTDDFLDDVRTHGCTVTVLLGAMAQFLGGRPPSPDDRKTGLRHLMVSPMIANHEEFSVRFGVTLCTGFNMTETSNPINSRGLVPPDPRTCGRVMPGYRVRLVDEHDRDVPIGTPGELVVRTDEPWLLMAGYWRRPEATVAAWRNLWFHTGDVMLQNEDGWFYYVDRRKDSIRRRGENISSLEVEAEVNCHPAVRECAVVAAPADDSEDEVRAFVILHDGAALEGEGLQQFLTGRLPRFMIPRYLDVVDAFPRTPSQRVRKNELRARAITASTWDARATQVRA